MIQDRMKQLSGINESVTAIKPGEFAYTTIKSGETYLIGAAEVTVHSFSHKAVTSNNIGRMVVDYSVRVQGRVISHTTTNYENFKDEMFRLEREQL